VPEEGKKADEALARALELELAQKRLRWQHDREKYRTLRVLSFAFLCIIILAGLAAFFFFFSRTNEMREQRSQPSPATEESPH
jgi:flagellar basal body-associated protein FliL